MSHKVNELYGSGRLPWLIICYGIILRIVQYLHNCSLEIDEARDTVIGILGKSLSDLFKHSDIYIPTPPVGFFLIEKIAVQIFGDSEYALRLYPLLAGELSLLLFYFVAKQYIKQKAIPIALVLFATLEPLIYYSAAVRPYSGDIMIVLIILFIAVRYIHSDRLTPYNTSLLSVIGAIAIWFSSPVVFTLSGVGTTLFFMSLSRKKRTEFVNLFFIFLAWGLSFMIYYLLYLHNLTKVEFFYTAVKGENAFMPFPISFSTVKWFITKFFGMFEETVGFFQWGIAGIAVLAFIIGCASIFSERKEKLLILTLPILFALLASSISLYPFLQRMIIFIVPSLLFLIAEGAEYIITKTSINARVVGYVFIGLLLFHPLLSSAHHLIKPLTTEEIKPILNYIKINWQSGDVIYIHYGAHPAFTYYAKKYDFEKNHYVIGIYAGDKNNQWAFSTDYLNAYTKDLDKLRGKNRIWILFSHTPMLNKGINEEVFFIYYLNSIGKQIDSHRDSGSSVYLYDLSSGIVDSYKDRDITNSLHWNF